ncbi:hypothetical protein F5X68DRAFT_259515 [Plectosphaerella plurivora]|uniref:Zn(2)-C6 fungal-type domain-containing protein n=1 Tax=Plectosphaerella plurivora TaxID=936078 RepID=A0A9P9AEF4_9PEZI|nr:hypothetical protein F5X68DRAFT_259515 [Plectosphaerella plurivora]
MQQRKSHTKSRNGCQGCKTRHIKCDEQTPSCANCISREAECVYIARKPRRTAAPPAIRRPRLVLTQEGHISSSSSDSMALLHARSPPRPSLTSSPLSFSSSSSSFPMLELELMHRWSTKTWQILYAVPVCTVSVQQHLTRASLGYGFMTKAILACAALDTAIYGGGAEPDSRAYHRAALQLMNEASADYRRQLQGNITRDNLWLLSEFSGLLGMFHFAVPATRAGSPPAVTAAAVASAAAKPGALEEDRSVLSRIMHLYDMTIASYELCALNWEWLFDSPSSASVIMRDYQTDLSLMNNLSPDVLDATKRMSEVQRIVRLPPTGNPDIDDADGAGPLAIDVFSYRVAVGHLRYAYAEDRIKGYCLSVASGAHVAGPEFGQGLRSREPVAMFVVVYWGVLMHWQSHDEMLWWIGSSGREMVREASELLVTSHIYDLADVREGIAWARRQVGLEPLVDFRDMFFEGANAKVYPPLPEDSVTWNLEALEVAG